MDLFRRFRNPGLRSGRALRVVFYYPGEEPTYLEDAHVVLYKNGVVDVFHREEQVSTHMQNVEIIWHSQREAKSLRLVKGEITQTH
jgi:hypothetical protein